jgi:hypothetical protein
MKKLLVFKVPNCVPCKQLEITIGEMENVEFIDSSVDFETALDFNIKKAPTAILLDDGVEIGRFIGLKTRDEILKFMS